MKWLIVSLLLAFGMEGFAQGYVISDLGSLSDQFTLERSKEVTTGGANYSMIKGTPFLDESFVAGEVVVNDSLRYKNIPLRYNMYSDKMEFKNEKQQTLEMDNTRMGWQFYFGNKKWANLQYLVNGQKVSGVLEWMVDGRIRLYKKYAVEFKPATKAAGYQDPEPDRFCRLDDHYLIAIDGALPDFCRSSKEVVEKLRSVKPGIDQYVKEQKLKLKTDAGLIKLVEYCNQ